jgi:hypothetical protein
MGSHPVNLALRFLLELAAWAATWMLIDAGHTTVGIVLGAVLVLHHAVSYDRVWWLWAGHR